MSGYTHGILESHSLDSWNLEVLVFDPLFFVRRRGGSDTSWRLVYANPLVFTPSNSVRRRGDFEG